MKRRILHLIAFALLATNIVRSQSKQDVIARHLDSLTSDAIQKGLFSGTIIMVKDGKPLYKKQYGYADWRNYRPITDSSLYNIGSLTKQFTEEMIRQLIKDGKIELNASLSKYLDLFPKEIGDKITIQQLLEMRSGLGDYFGSREFQQIEQTNFKLADILNIIKKQPLLFEPGTSQMYSNSGYAVLGAIIEKVTEKSYEENLRERIAEPLGITAICYTKAEKAAQANRAFGHIPGFEGDKITVDDISNSHPDGGVYTNLSGLLKFTEAKRMHTLPSGYPYAVAANFVGGTPPWNSAIGYTAEGISYVIMCNVGESADKISMRVGSILRFVPYPPLTYPMKVTLYHLLEEKGIAYIEQSLQDLCRQDRHPLDDRFLNNYGYQFLLGGKADMAIQLFLLNAKLYPKLPNVYDSLGEAYLQSGDNVNARKYYQKVLEIDPNNGRVKDVLNRMIN